MEMYITRVELHGIAHDEKKYEDLHDLMESASFSRTIKGQDEVTYHLPPAEYFFYGTQSIEVVYNLAQIAANAVTLKNAVFVSQLKSARWEGLIPV